MDADQADELDNWYYKGRDDGLAENVREAVAAERELFRGYLSPTEVANLCEAAKQREAEAVLAEREACAAICDVEAAAAKFCSRLAGAEMAAKTAEALAVAIRKRGES